MNRIEEEETKEQIEGYLLTAMESLDEAQHLMRKMPQVRDHEKNSAQIGSINTKIKRLLNRRYDRLARERGL